MNETDMPEIVRHLVDEERRALPVDTGAFDELRAHLREAFGRQIVQVRRIFALARALCTATQIVREAEDIG